MDLLRLGKEDLVSLLIEPVELVGVDALSHEDAKECEDNDQADGGLQEVDGLAQGPVLVTGEFADNLIVGDADVRFDGKGVGIAPKEICPVVHGLDVAVDDDVSVLVLVGVDHIGDKFLTFPKPFDEDEGPCRYLVVVALKLFLVVRILLAHGVRLDDVEGRVPDVDLSAREPVGDGGGKDGEHDEADDAKDDVQKNVSNFSRFPLAVQEGGKRAVPGLLQIIGVKDGDVLLDDVVVMLLKDESLPGTVEENEGAEKEEQHEKHADQNDNPCNLVHGNLFEIGIFFPSALILPPPALFVYENCVFHKIFTIFEQTKIPCR